MLKVNVSCFHLCLTFTTLLANSADDKLMILFLIFPTQQDLTFHANCLHWRQFAWNVKPVFWKNIYFKMMSAENFLSRVVSINSTFAWIQVSRHHFVTDADQRWWSWSVNIYVKVLCQVLSFFLYLWKSSLQIVDMSLVLLQDGNRSDDSI